VKKMPKQEHEAEFKEQAVKHAQPVDPPPSCNAGESKARTVALVQPVTERGGKNFVAASERIAVFDNDGRLCAEQPLYFQAPFMAPTQELAVDPTAECA
jgi:hypothetical protein